MSPPFPAGGTSTTASDWQSGLLVLPSTIPPLATVGWSIYNSRAGPGIEPVGSAAARGVYVLARGQGCQVER